MKKEETKEKNRRLAIHFFHDELIAYGSYAEYEYRQLVIKTIKLKKEQPIRLEVFKLLPDEAKNDLPKDIRKAHKNFCKAYTRWPKKARKSFHDKWCGCKYYDAETDKLIFDKKKK